MRVAISSLSLALAILSGCSVYDASLLEGPPPDGGAGGSGGGDKCQHATYPAPPDEGDGSDVEFVAAMQTIDFGSEPTTPGHHAYDGIGFDLDKTCSAAVGPYSCLEPEWAGADHTDGQGGRDNALSALITDIAGIVPTFGNAAYNQQIAAGEASILIRVSEYNGEANDRQVRFALFTPMPLGKTPTWDGDDVWPIASDSVNGDLDHPKYEDPNAYVSNGTLVATLPKVGLRLSVGIAAGEISTLTLDLSGAFVTAKVVKNDQGQWELDDGTLAGLWPVQSLVSQLGNLPDALVPTDPPPLCTNRGTYSLFRQKVCSYVDSFNGVPGPTSQCDALSLGVGIGTKPAQLGPVTQFTPPDARCTPDTDPANDHCGDPAPPTD